MDIVCYRVKGTHQTEMLSRQVARHENAIDVACRESLNNDVRISWCDKELRVNFLADKTKYLKFVFEETEPTD